MPARAASLWAGGACVAALGFGSFLAVDELRRGPDETLDATGLPVVAPEVAKTAGHALFRPTPIPPLDETAAQRARSSQQHYLSGVLRFQKAEYAEAAREWKLALELDPANADARAGLSRIPSAPGGSR